MDESVSTAKQIALAASAFERQRTGHAPTAVTVVLGEDTLVITLRDVLSPADDIRRAAANQVPPAEAQP